MMPTTEPPSFPIKRALSPRNQFSSSVCVEAIAHPYSGGCKRFEGLITQHYPQKGSRGAMFDLVIVPETESNVKKKNAFGR